jgi:hypothetical protein
MALGCPVHLGVVLSLTLVATAPGQVQFADHQADRICVSNADFYEAAFRKSDGRILHLVDKTTNQEVSCGNVFGPWVLRFSDGTWLGGNAFSPTHPSRRFSYAWDAQSSWLRLTYAATGTHACTVTISVQPSAGPEFDTVLSITNQSDLDVELIAYPVHLAFRRDRIKGVYLPYIEGVRLLPGFFERGKRFSSRYPGQMFTDFAYTQLTAGSFAVYGVQDPRAPLIPADWKILPHEDFAGGLNKYHRDFTVAIGPGQQWHAPTTVFSIGTTLTAAMTNYWTRNGHDAMPTLADKLGAERLARLSQAVLIKRDFVQGSSWTFASFQEFLPTLPARNLLHLVGFGAGGFDRNYPDYLPPSPALGTLAELQALTASARSAGHLVMPYTNPTWWDGQSPTMNRLGIGVVARDRDGEPIKETYKGRSGYVVSPHAPAVIARQDQTRDEFTAIVPSDFLFEDQIGARQKPNYDGNPAATSPTGYTQGMVNLARRSAQRLPIMTEGGFDRLSWHESGFCNSLRIGWHGWSEDIFDPYPLVPLWAHEYLYFNAHNLAGHVMSNDLPALTYFVSMGYALSHDLYTLDLAWLKLLDKFQKHLIAPWMGGGMTAFEELPTPGRTRTTFGEGTIVTANRTASPMARGSHVIAPHGFVAEKNGVVTGGVLLSLNGQPLAGTAPHYLIFARDAQRIRIYQPRGDDGPLTIQRPASWRDEQRVRAAMVLESAARHPRPVTVDATGMRIDYTGQFNGQPVDRLELTYGASGTAD